MGSADRDESIDRPVDMHGLILAFCVSLLRLNVEVKPAAVLCFVASFFVNDLAVAVGPLSSSFDFPRVELPHFPLPLA